MGNDYDNNGSDSSNDSKCNVAIVNALQLEATQDIPAFCRFNYDTMPSLISLNLSIVVLYRFCC